MNKRRKRRAGATETFSVSVDLETKRALRKLADSDYDGNLSALVTDFAEDARRRMAAVAYLRRHQVPDPTPSELTSIDVELDREARYWRRRRKRRDVA